MPIDIIYLLHTAPATVVQQLFLWDYRQHLRVFMEALKWEYDIIASEAVHRLRSVSGISWNISIHRTQFWKISGKSQGEFPHGLTGSS